MVNPLFSPAENVIIVPEKNSEQNVITLDELEKIPALPWIARELEDYINDERAGKYLMRCFSDCLTWPKIIEKVIIKQPIRKKYSLYFVGNYPILARYIEVTGTPTIAETVKVKIYYIIIEDETGRIVMSNFENYVRNPTIVQDNIKYSSLDVPIRFGSMSGTWTVFRNDHVPCFTHNEFVEFDHTKKLMNSEL